MEKNDTYHRLQDDHLTGGGGGGGGGESSFQKIEDSNCSTVDYLSPSASSFYAVGDDPSIGSPSDGMVVVAAAAASTVSSTSWAIGVAKTTTNPQHDPTRVTTPTTTPPPPTTTTTIPPTTDNDEDDDNDDVFFEQVLFFMAGLGSSVGYIATLSSLVYYKILFGPSSFVQLNLAIYLPLVPISLAQARWDSQYDRHYNTKVTFVTRLIVGFGCVVFGTIGMILSSAPTTTSATTTMNEENNRIILTNPEEDPMDGNTTDDAIVFTSDEGIIIIHNTTAKLGWVIWNALLQGIGGAILYGQLNQLASFVGSRCTDNTTSTGATIPGRSRSATPSANNGEDNGGVDGDDNDNDSNRDADDDTKERNGDRATIPIGSCLDRNHNDQNDSDGDGDDNEHDHDDVVPRKFKAAVSSGVQASAIIVLIASFGSGFKTMNSHRFGTFLWSIVAVEVICFLMSLWLLVARPKVVKSMIVRDSSMRRSVGNMMALVGRESITSDVDNDPEAQSLLRRREEMAMCTNIQSSFSISLRPMPLQQYEGPTNDGILLMEPLLRSRSSLAIQSAAAAAAAAAAATTAEGLLPSSKSQLLLLHNNQSNDSIPSSSSISPQLPLVLLSSSSTCDLDADALWYYTKSCCWALAMTLVPSFLVGSWFTRVQTDWMELAQILFYVRIGMDLIGRLATLSFPLSSVQLILRLASLRWIGVILFFLNANGTLGKDSSLVERNRDCISILLVAVIAFFSGYLVTSSYQLAPQQLPMDARISNNTTKQASLLTVAFSISAVGGLLSSFILIAIGL
jgi:hypothetical protein